MQEDQEVPIQSCYGVTDGCRNRGLAIILAFFFGWAGAHRFYIGKPVSGLVYLLFFWTGIPALLGVIEAIIFCAVSDEEFNRDWCA